MGRNAPILSTKIQMFITGHRLPQRIPIGKLCLWVVALEFQKFPCSNQKMCCFILISFFLGISGVKKSTIGCLIREKHWFHHLSEQPVHGFVHLHHYHLQDLVSTFHRGYMTQTPHVVNSFSVFIRSGHQV